MTLLHELAHALRRSTCATFLESYNLFTPRESDLPIVQSGYQKQEPILNIDKIEQASIKTILMTEHERQKYRGEAGKTLEVYLLGEKTLEKINDRAAAYLLSKPFDNLESFQKKFHEENAKGGDYVGMSKGASNSVEFFSRRCGTSLKTKYDT